MFSGVPNLAYAFGYTNASWTLKADLTAGYVCRLLDHMERHGHAVAVPRARPFGRDPPVPRPHIGLRAARPGHPAAPGHDASRGGSTRTTCSTSGPCASSASTTARSSSRRHRRRMPLQWREQSRRWRRSRSSSPGGGARRGAGGRRLRLHCGGRRCAPAALRWAGRRPARSGRQQRAGAVALRPPPRSAGRLRQLGPEYGPSNSRSRRGVPLQPRCAALLGAAEAPQPPPTRASA